jgi:hypothetical protein
MELLEIRKILFVQLNPIFNNLGFILIDKGQDPLRYSPIVRQKTTKIKLDIFYK